MKILVADEVARRVMVEGRIDMVVTIVFCDIESDAVCLEALIAQPVSILLVHARYWWCAHDIL